MPYIVVTSEDQELHRLQFDRPITIGRELSCDVWVGDPSLSRVHCRIELDDRGRWIVVDQNSRNGVYVKKQRFARCTAMDGDVFRLGGIKVQYYAERPPSRRPATPLETHHASLMTPLVGKVSDHAAPALAAKTTRFRTRPMPVPKPRLTADPNEPLVRPFSLAFQRPAPRPILSPETPAMVMEEKSASEQSRSWFSTLFRRRAS